MAAIFKRELNAYFESPLGYVFLAAYDLLAGFFFFNYNLYSNTTDLRTLFDLLFTVTIFLIPILTMRLMSEERKAKTDQLLMMAPVTATSIIVAKFFAALLVYLAAMSITLVMAGVMSFYAAPEWPVVLGHFIGLLLLGAALIAVGLLISSLTENQIIAAVGGFCVGLLLMLLDALAGVISNPFFARLVTDLSFYTRYQNFTLGMIDLADIVFFGSLTALFLFFSVAVFENRRLS